VVTLVVRRSIASLSTAWSLFAKVVLWLKTEQARSDLLAALCAPFASLYVKLRPWP
jgi:hypothetical protein